MRASPHDNQDDQALIESIRGGDLVAYATLRERHGLRIANLIRRRLTDKGCSSPGNDAQIVIEETWEQIYQKLGQVRETFAGWSHTVAENQVNLHLTKCLKEKDHTRQLDDGLPIAEFFDFWRAYEAHSIVMRMFEEAPKIYPKSNFGRIFEMRWKDDLDFKEIASRLETTAVSARTTYIRGLKELKRRLGLD